MPLPSSCLTNRLNELSEILLITESVTNGAFAVGVGKPKDPTWNSAGATMRERTRHDTFLKKELDHKPRRFPAISADILHGQGSKGVHNLCVHRHDETFNTLPGSKATQWIAVHQSGVSTYEYNL